MSRAALSRILQYTISSALKVFDSSMQIKFFRGTQVASMGKKKFHMMAVLYWLPKDCDRLSKFCWIDTMMHIPKLCIHVGDIGRKWKNRCFGIIFDWRGRKKILVAHNHITWVYIVPLAILTTQICQQSLVCISEIDTITPNFMINDFFWESQSKNYRY